MHTQGIWKGETNNRNGQKYVRVFVENRTIFEVPIHTDEDLYNCMLMEMAPALLKDLKTALEDSDHTHACNWTNGECDCWMREAERHIKLAEGKPPIMVKKELPEIDIRHVGSSCGNCSQRKECEIKATLTPPFISCKYWKAEELIEGGENIVSEKSEGLYEEDPDCDLDTCDYLYSGGKCHSGDYENCKYFIIKAENKKLREVNRQYADTIARMDEAAIKGDKVCAEYYDEIVEMRKENEELREEKEEFHNKFCKTIKERDKARCVARMLSAKMYYVENKTLMSYDTPGPTNIKCLCTIDFMPSDDKLMQIWWYDKSRNRINWDYYVKEAIKETGRE